MNQTPTPNRPRNRYAIDVNESVGPFLFRTGCFLKHPAYSVVVPHKLRLPIRRWSRDLYFFLRVTEGSAVVTTPYPDAHIRLIDVPVNARFIVNLDHLLGVSETMFFRGVWRIDLISLVSLKLRYTYVEGPGKLLVFGLGDTEIETISGTSAYYDPGCVIGWDNSLAIGIASRGTSWSAFWSLEELVLDYFEGNGRVLTQSSTMRKLPRHFHHGKSQSTFIDKLNALLGLRP